MTMRHAPRHVQGLPTLTEVVDLPMPEGAAPPGAQALPTPEPSEPSVVDAAPSVWPNGDEAELLAQVQVDVQRQVEQVLEQRLREVIEPMLARTGEALVRELRAELAAMLYDAVARSATRESARRHER